MKINSINLFENEICEFKTSLAELDKGIEAIAAMLNKHEKAEVFYGVSNNGEVLGLKGQLGEETIKRISVRINELIKPTVVPTIALEYYGDLAIAHVTASGGRKPYSCGGDYRIRVGSENKKIDPELLGELFYSSASSSLELFECINQNLTFNRLKFLYHNQNIPINDNNFEINMNLKINGKYNLLADLLADDNNTSIKVVRFAGLDKSNMIIRNEYGYKCLLVAMKEAKDYVLSLNETKVDITSSLERKEERLFDDHVFEEAWTNACLHNKWIRNIPPAIYIFSNRIEIISNGGLPFNYSKEDFYNGISNPINPGLFKIMGQLGLAEQTGHGNPEIVKRYGKEAFNIENSHICVTIPFAFEPSMKQVNMDGLDESHIKILMIIKDNPSYSKDQISELAALGTTRVQQIINDLKNMGKVERMGSKKSGYWKVK